MSASPHRINKDALESLWLKSIASAREATIEKNLVPKARVKKLRRMQSQNFVARAAQEVVELFAAVRHWA